MGDHVEIYQKIVQCQCLLPPPIAFLNGPNSYVIWKNGQEIGHVEEHEDCFCQKVCCPSTRKYEGKIVPKHGGSHFKVQRETAICQFLPCACFMPGCWPTAKVYDANGQ